MLNTKIKYLLKTFEEEFGQTELYVRAPGRANIIGEHIDYCHGKVLPFAIPESMYFVVGKSMHPESQILFLDTGEKLNLNSYSRVTARNKYFLKCLEVLKEKGYSIGQFNLLFTSDIPIGGGLSSSSALCCGFITALGTLFKLKLDRKKIISLSSEAEYGLGVEGGIMDQYAIMYSRQRMGLLLDCRTSDYSHIEIDSNCFRFLLIDTGIKHNLVNSAYNKRRHQIQKGFMHLKASLSNIDSYRDLRIDHTRLIKDDLISKRLTHVITEMQRVEQALEALNEKRVEMMGRVLNASHSSLKDNYEVSCEEADYLTLQFNNLDITHGSRIVGGGFGGHVIGLIKKYDQNRIDEIKTMYKRKFDKDLKVLKTQASQGLELVVRGNYS